MTSIPQNLRSGKFMVHVQRGVTAVFLIISFASAGNSSAFSVNQSLRDLKPNTAKYLGVYKSRQLSECVLDPSGVIAYSKLTYDSNHHQMLLWGGGHATTLRDDVDVFNLDSLSWRSAYDSTPMKEMTKANWDLTTGGWKSTGQPISRHSYDMLTFAPNRGELILLTRTSTGSDCVASWRKEFDQTAHTNPGKVWHYNPSTKSWRASNASAAAWKSFPASEFDPISGKIILIGPYGLYTYDPINEIAVQHQNFARGELNITQNLIYYPPDQRMYYVLNNGDVFEVTLDRKDFRRSTISRVTGITGTPPPGKVSSNGEASGLAYDSVNKIIGGAIANGLFYAYNPEKKSWTAKKMNLSKPGLSSGNLGNAYTIDYDPVNNAFIYIAFGSNPNKASEKTVWAYKYDEP